jgi:hypothetical protein
MLFGENTGGQYYDYILGDFPQFLAKIFADFLANRGFPAAI